KQGKRPKSWSRPQLKASLALFRPPPFTFARWARGRRPARLEPAKKAIRRYVKRISKNADLLATMRERRVTAIFQQVRAKACAMDVPCLKVVARKPAGKEGRPGSARICNCVGSSAGQRWSLGRVSPTSLCPVPAGLEPQGRGWDRSRAQP